MKTSAADVRRILQEKVAPVLGAHGGDIELIELTADGVARVRLIGACSHCMGAMQTMESVVTAILTAECPDITEVIADDSVDEELLAEAMKILNRTQPH